ncbi:unnamed protein product, partial [Ectocarpus sp. 12 AP-2014]
MRLLIRPTHDRSSLTCLFLVNVLCLSFRWHRLGRLVLSSRFYLRAPLRSIRPLWGNAIKFRLAFSRHPGAGAISPTGAMHNEMPHTTGLLVLSNVVVVRTHSGTIFPIGVIS